MRAQKRLNEAGWPGLELRIHGTCEPRRRLVRQRRQWRQAEQRVDEADDRIVVALLMRHHVGPRIGRDHEQRDTRATAERKARGVVAENAGRHVVVVAFGLVVGDDDGALAPVWAVGDGVDLVGDQRLADLRVGVARMVVVTIEVGADIGGVRRAGRVRRVGLHAHDIVIAAADVEHAAGRRQRGLLHIAEEVAKTMQICVLHRVVVDVAEVLRPVMVPDVAGVRHRADAVAVRQPAFGAVAVLIPAPTIRRAAPLGDIQNVVLDILQVEARVGVVRRDIERLAATKRQRQAGEGKVRGDIGGDAGLVLALRHTARGAGVARRRLDVGRLARLARVLRIGRGQAGDRVVGDRHRNRAIGLGRRRVRMLHPLRLAGLPGDHGDRVRRRRSDRRLEDVVEQGELVGVVPQERDGVAVDIRHRQLTELLRF